MFPYMHGSTAKTIRYKIFFKFYIAYELSQYKTMKKINIFLKFVSKMEFRVLRIMHRYSFFLSFT